MASEIREKILKKLFEEYPEELSRENLQKAVGVADDVFERHLYYLEGKGLIQFKLGGHLVGINIEGIHLLGEDVVTRDTVKKILIHLENIFPKYEESESLQTLLNVDSKELRRIVKYLEEAGFVTMQGFLGRKFRIKITSHGIDQLENL